MLYQARKALAPKLNSASVRRLISPLPQQLPDATTTRNTGRRVTKEAKAVGERALEALQRAVRLIAISKYMSNAPARLRQGKQSEEAARGLGTSLLGQGEEHLPGREADYRREGDMLEHVDGLVDEKESREVLTGAKAKAMANQEKERHWAMTEQFYAHLATAAQRLEAKKTTDRG